MGDYKNHANKAQCGSCGCHKVPEPVMAAEMHVLVHAFLHSYMFLERLEELLGLQITFEALVDSRALVNVIAEVSGAPVRRLQIDVCMFRELPQEELENIGWIPGNHKAADALRKEMVTKGSKIWRLMTSNILDIAAIGWSVRRVEKVSCCRQEEGG